MTHTPPPPSPTKRGSKDTAKKLFKSDRGEGEAHPFLPPKETCTKVIREEIDRNMNQKHDQ